MVIKLLEFRNITFAFQPARPYAFISLMAAGFSGGKGTK